MERFRRGAKIHTAKPNVPADVTNIVGISAGEWHSLGLRPDGSIRMWGTLFGGITNVPPEGTNVALLALGPGSHHPLGLRQDGSIVTWGSSAYAVTNIPPTISNVVGVAAGGGFHAALRGDGTVAVWGDNTGGQTNVPASATNIVALAAGWNHVVGLRANGTLLAWGSISSLPPSLGATNIVDVACGANHFLAVRRDGTVLAYGNNNYGQTTVPRWATNIAAIAGTAYSSLAVVGDGRPVLVKPLVDRAVVSGATAYFRTLAFGAVPITYQWRLNGTDIPGATNAVLVLNGLHPSQVGSYSVVISNQLGSVTNVCALSLIPLIINTQPLSQKAYTGETITFSVGVAGQIPYTFQWSFNGNPISSATNSSLVLTNVQAADAGLYSVNVGNIYTNVVSSNASLTVTPILINQEASDQVIFRGGTCTFTIAAQASSPLTYQWQFGGTNLDGATASALTISNAQWSQSGLYRVVLATPTATTNSMPAMLSVVPVAAWGLGTSGQTAVPAGTTNITAVAAGSFSSLALLRDGTVAVWPTNAYGTQMAAPNLTNLVALVAGVDHALGLRADGTVVAWGANTFGQTNVPAGVTQTVAIAAGYYHSLGLTSDGQVYAWGQNNYGQTNVPPDLTNVVAIAAGDFFSLALRSDGTVAAWGYNEDGETNVPPTLTNAIAISAGPFHALALGADGSLTPWGSSNWTSIGPGNVTNVVAISAGYLSSVALQSNGTVVAWGYPWAGQTNIPIGLTNVIAIASGSYHNLALVGDHPPLPDGPLMVPSRADGIFRITLASQSGRVYRLEYKNSFDEPGWTALPLVPGTGALITLTDSSATTSQRFYRVRKW